MTDEIATRERILDAATSVFMEQGSAGARMQEIADTAGVNKALLHYYFRDKATLSRAVFRRAMSGIIQPVMGVLASEMPLPEKMRTTVDLYVGGLSEIPEVAGYVQAEIHFNPDLLSDFVREVLGHAPGDLRTLVLARLSDQIDAAVAAGEMRPMPAEQLVVNLLGLCVFPFAMRPLITLILGGDEAFSGFIADRRRLLPEFLLQAIRP